MTLRCEISGILSLKPYFASFFVCLCLVIVVNGEPSTHPPFATEELALSDEANLDKEDPAKGSVLELQQRLVDTVFDHVRLTHVPYIWGGWSLASKRVCNACRRCVRSENIELKRRAQSCKDCRKCGMDCSHFVHAVFRKAGLPYPYASSREMATQSSEGMAKHFQFVDLGKQIAELQPGDLVVFPRHVAIITRVTGSGRADLAHISRYRGASKYLLGGFRHDLDVSITEYRGGFIRILRHERLIKSPHHLSMPRRVAIGVIGTLVETFFSRA